MSGFCHVSMLIELDSEAWPPEPAAYIKTSEYFPKRSRTLVHESIHYWQQLAHGYLLALAEEDWTRMLAWEQNGGSATTGPRRAHYHQPEGQNGFTASDVCESSARFWEVLLTGPAEILRQANGRPQPLSDQAFDEAMHLGGNYALPYAVARRVLDRESGLVIFPFLTHFALKTSRPAFFFERFVEEAAPDAAGRAKDLGATGLYRLFENRCSEIARREGEAALLHAPDLFRQSPLRANRVYRWSFRRLARLETAADYSICLPGLQRDVLAMLLTPPCIRFRDRQTISVGHRYLERASGASWLERRRAEHAARECLAIQERWEKFQNAMREG
jgi:hypothetical protein